MLLGMLAVPALADPAPTVTLENGTYSLASLTSSLGMFKIDDGKALLAPYVVVNGDDAYLVVTSGADRYDRLYIGLYSDVQNDTESLMGVTGIPVYSSSATSGYNDGNGIVVGYTFAAKLARTQLESILADDGKLNFVVRYRADYSASSDNGALNANAGKWYKASSDPFFTLGALTKTSDSTDLPAAPVPTTTSLENGTYSLASLTSSLGMFKIDDGKALLAPYVVVNGDDAYLVVTSGADRYDRLYIGLYSDVQNDTESLMGVTGIPVYSSSATSGYNDGNGIVVGYTFAAKLARTQLESILADDGKLNFVVRYRADYSASSDNGALNANAGKWYKASSDPFFTLGALTKTSDSTDLPAAPSGSGSGSSTEPINLHITNNTGMFKAVTASLETLGGKTTLVMALSGTGYRELFKGTYEEAVANGSNTDNWIHGYQNANGKWEFRIPVAEGETYLPLVAISNTYYNNYLNNQNPLERAFYPRQAEINAADGELITGDYHSTRRLTVTNNTSKFSLSAAALDTVGGPNSNGYQITLQLTMGSDSLGKAFVGYGADVTESSKTYDIGEGRVFEIPVRWIGEVGKPETLTDLLKEPIIISFFSVKNQAWSSVRLFTVSEADGTLVVDTAPAQGADYTAVDAALAKIPADLSLYTDASAADLTTAKNAVVRGLAADKQADVDAMAQNIESAVGALVLKTTEPTQPTSNIDEVRRMIQALSADANTYTAADLASVEAIQAAFDALSAADQAILDAELSHPGSSQPLGRILESALWTVWSFAEADNSTTLPDGTYSASTNPALNSVYSKGKSTSSRQRPWSVKEVTVLDGKVYATITVESETYPGIMLHGLTYPRTNTSGNCEFANVPIDLNSTFYFNGVSSSMPAPIAFSLTTVIEEPGSAPQESADYTAVDAALAKIPADLSTYTDTSVAALNTARDAVVRGLAVDQQAVVDAMAQAIESAVSALVLKSTQPGGEEGSPGGSGDGTDSEDSQRIDLTIDNTTGMFKAEYAYVEIVDGVSTLIVALTGQTYHYLIPGSYAQAVSMGESRAAWIIGEQDSAGKWFFTIPLDAGQSYIPVVSVSQTYLTSYENGQNSLARSYYPRQFVLDLDAATLTVGDYDETIYVSVSSSVDSFQVYGSTSMQVVGGPNSNNFSVSFTLEMQNEIYDQVTYPTVDGNAIGTETAELSGGSFAISIQNAPNLPAFRDQEPIELVCHVAGTDKTILLSITIDLLDRSITIEGDDSGVAVAAADENAETGNASEETAGVVAGLDVTAETEDGRATAAVDADAVNAALEEKAEADTLSVKVESADADTVELTLDAEALKAVSEGGAALRVETALGMVTLSKDELGKLAAAEGNVAVTLSAKEDGSVTLDITVDGEPADLTVMAALPAAEGSQVLILVKEDGTEEVIRKSLVEDGVAYAFLPAGSTVKAADRSMDFEDVGDSWYSEYVDFVSSHRLFTGVSETEFAPDASMTRAMLVTVLYRLESEPENSSTGSVKFPDVTDGSWYADAVDWAAGIGIFVGRENGFAPDASIIRQEMATALYRYVKALGLDTEAKGSLEDFSDGSSVASWAQDAMAWAVGAGLFEGDDTGRLNPDSDATRAEVAALIARLVKYLVK